jgi:hypothetical protein
MTYVIVNITYVIPNIGYDKNLNTVSATPQKYIEIKTF